MEGIGYLRHCFGNAWRWVRMVCGAPTIVSFLLCFALDWGRGEDIVRDGQLRLLLFCCGATSYATLKKPLTHGPAAFLSYAVIMWVLHEQPAYGAFHLICFSAACLVAHWLARAERFPAILSYLGALQASLGIGQWLGWNLWGYQEAWAQFKPTGFYGQETIFGAFLVACLAPALFTRRYLCAAPILLCAYATHSSFTACATGVVFFIWILTIIMVRPGIALAAIFGTFFVAWAWFHRGSDWLDPNGRVEFFRVGYRWWRERTIFGHGSGSWYPQAPLALPNNFRLTHQHNEYLEFLGEYGALGAALLLPAIYTFIRRFRLTWHHAACVGLMVDALGNFPFHIASLGVIFLTCWLLSVRTEPCMIQWKAITEDD